MSQTAPAAGDLGPQVQVLADEVRTYLSLHGGALDESDEQGLERFTEVFLLPAFAAVWEQGRRTPRPAATGSPVHVSRAAIPPDGTDTRPAVQQQTLNPYSVPRLRRRTLWWHRLLTSTTETTSTRTKR